MPLPLLLVTNFEEKKNQGAAFKDNFVFQNWSLDLKIVRPTNVFFFILFFSRCYDDIRRNNNKKAFYQTEYVLSI